MMSRLARWLGVLIFSAICAYLIYDVTKRTYYDPFLQEEVPKGFAKFGIDISHHQGVIDFEKVHAFRFHDSISFVYLKATEGCLHKDRNFAKNATELEKYDLAYGFYHFYQPNESAVKQADHFIRAISSFNFNLKPVIDVELINPLNSVEIIDSLQVFIQKITEQFKVKPIVYTFASYYRDYLKDKLSKEIFFWIANYNHDESLLTDEQVVIWQFSERGRVNGISEWVDLNVGKVSFDTIARM
jgi:lysozyme